MTYHLELRTFYLSPPHPTTLPARWKWKLLSRVWLCDPMDYRVHGILQARILEWVAFPFSRVSSQPRDRTQVYLRGRRILYQLSHKGSCGWGSHPQVEHNYVLFVQREKLSKVQKGSQQCIKAPKWQILIRRSKSGARNSGPPPSQGAAWEPTERWCRPAWTLAPFIACSGSPALSFPALELPVWSGWGQLVIWELLQRTELLWEQINTVQWSTWCSGQMKGRFWRHQVKNSSQSCYILREWLSSVFSG